MHIAVMGTGGVGGYFGGLLARSGEEVTFVARGAHLAAIREHGLRVESVHGDFLVAGARITDDPASVGAVDLVLFATKTYQLEDAATAMLPLIGSDTAVLPLHNGVDAAERTAAIVGAEHVVGGVCYVGSKVASPGVIRQESTFRKVIAGELGGGVTRRVQEIVDAIAASGAVAETTDDIHAARWTKFAFIAPFSGVGAATRVPAGEINATPETRAMLATAIREVAAVARAGGVSLAQDVAERQIAFCDALDPHITASMQRDMLDGKPSELDSIIGVLVRKAELLGVDAPVFRFLHATLLPQEKRARSGQTG